MCSVLQTGVTVKLCVCIPGGPLDPLCRVLPHHRSSFVTQLPLLVAQKRDCQSEAAEGKGDPWVPYCSLHTQSGVWPPLAPINIC